MIIDLILVQVGLYVSPHRVRQPREIAVSLLSSSLRLPLPPLLPSLPAPQVGLYVSPHQVRQGDRGLIIIGASLEGGDVASGEGLEGVDGEREGGRRV